VAKDGDTIVVVEVRTRGVTAWQTGMESIARTKARRVRSAGEKLWRQRFLRDPTVNRMRFDVAVVTFDETGAPSIEYARGVF
jgi:Holliday junction resolvase-like predicted endonuclease